MAKITFLINGDKRGFDVPVGEQNILQAAMNGGIHIDHPCGGAGMCGACKVDVVEGVENTDALTDNDEIFGLTGNERRTCQCKINGDMTVEVPCE